MNVLSLFDGISCGQVALQRAGIDVDKYYASEIDKYAIQVTQQNYPETIQIGDVTKVKASDLTKIDLLIGGSPCQGFSTVGNGLNFEHKQSKLFFEYVRVLNEIKPKYFLLENVRMKKEYQEIISRCLGVTPILIDSALMSAQSRKRLYWTNIPNVKQPHDRKICINDILEKNPNAECYLKNRKGSIAYVLGKYENFYAKNHYYPKMFNPYNCAEITDKSPTLTATGCRISVSSTVIIDDNGKKRSLSPQEWERLQTLPSGYTSGLTNTQRYNVIGNGWTVDVIAHILKNII